MFLKPVSPCNSGIAGIHLYSGPNSTWIGRNWTTIASIWPNLNWLSDSVSVLAVVDLYTPCSDSEDQFLMWPQCALNCLLISPFWVQLSTTHQSGGHDHCLCRCTRVHVRVCGLTWTCVSLQQSVQSVNTAVSGSKTCYCVYVKVLYQRVLPLRNFLVCRKYEFCVEGGEPTMLYSSETAGTCTCLTTITPRALYPCSQTPPCTITLSVYDMSITASICLLSDILAPSGHLHYLWLRVAPSWAHCPNTLKSWNTITCSTGYCSVT